MIEKNIVVCSTCKKLHHKECWEYNLNRCTTFTCKGIAIDYELMIVRNTETENTNILMEKKLEEKFLEPVKYKPEKPLPKAKIEKENDNKKIIVKNTKLTDILNNKKNYKNNNNNYSKIEPPEYIPDYVYDSLSDYHKRLKEEKLRMSSIITKNPYKNLKLKNNKENYNKKTNFYPKPPDYIPDYVNEDIETYHKRLQSEKLKSIIFKKMGNFITNNIRKKREEYILPRPDPFIPEFVHRDLKEYVKELIEEKKKKLIKRKIKNSYDNLSNILVNENIISEINIPKPEILLPGYIYSDNKDFDTKFLTSLVKTKKCINCKKDISFRLEVCNFCNYKQIHINKKKLIDYADIINKLIKENDKYDILTDNKNIYINNEEIKRIFLSPSSKYITFINQSNYFKIIDIDTCSIKVILKGHKGKVTSAFFTQDSKYIYTGSTDTLIKKWDVESGKCLNTLQGHEITVDLLEYSYVNQTIISGGGFGVLKVWDLNNNKIKKVINDESKWINTLDYSINNFFFCNR
ncbi:MAG: hypothetical protein KatS3mg068_0105 [Candidatus Sericytochromatia bacterium]|nr:MAG: hypothetical protein KatS3mg068_0105 [Candidatus Sericytochromatia bacterium]